MSFEIKYQTRNGGLFHIIIPRDVSASEAHELAQLALNVTRISEAIGVEEWHGPPKVYGPEPPPNLANHIASGNTGSLYSQTKLGERPVDTINMSDYVEPKEGVRIKMLAFPEVRVKAVNAFRNHTGISIVGSKEIVYGNHPCPILKQEVAEKIMDEFRNLQVYAKIVPADNQSRAA